MKLAFTLATFVLASSAFATDYFAKIDKVDCKIVNGNVTRTLNFGKDFTASVTETKTVSMNGLAPFIEKAIATARDLESADPDFSYKMNHEGKMYNLSTEDSKESMAIVRMITNVCR